MYSSWSGAVHCFNSLNLFPLAKVSWEVVEGGSVSQGWRTAATLDI